MRPSPTIAVRCTKAASSSSAGEVARAFFREQAARAGEKGMPLLGIHLLLKGEGPAMFANVVSLYEEGVMAPIELVCRARAEGEA